MKALLLLMVTACPFLAAAQLDNKVPDSLAHKAKQEVKNTSDSLITDFLNSFISIDSIQNPFDKLSLDKDSIKTKFKEKLKSIRPVGRIGIGYDYGLLTGYIDTTNNAPMSIFRSDADLSLDVFSLPIKFSYNYSTFRNPLGVNNYIRFSLDTEKLKMLAEEKKNELGGQVDEQIGQVQNGKKALSGKMGYAEVLMDKLNREANKYKDELQSYESQITDAESAYAAIPIDSAALMERGKDSLNTMGDQSKIDSLEVKYEKARAKYDRAMELYDTVQKIYTKALELYNTYSKWEEQLNTSKSKLDGYSGLLSKDALEKAATDSLTGRKDSFLGSIKTLDLGLTYPKTTALSDNSVPIKGIHLEIQRKNWYSSIAAGIMMNNLMVSNDIVQNKLIYSQNLFNQFDFQEIRHQGFLVSAVSGYGTPESNHAFLGIRYLTNSKFPSSDPLITDSTMVPSVGLELDTRFIPKFLPKTVIDLVYGKTSDSQKLADGTRGDPFSSIFSSDRTNTGLFRVYQPLSRIKSDLETSVRWIDPQADVRSIGVLQPNNVRLELRTNHQVMKRLRIGFNYRNDRNNVDNRMDSTRHLHLFGGQFTGSIGKRISYFGSLHYLTQTTKSDTLLLSKMNNYMYGAGIMCNYTIHEIENSASFNYNDYLLSDSVSTGLFRNISIQNMTMFAEGQNTFTLSYFTARYGAEPSNTAFIIGDEFALQRKRIKVIVGLKLALGGEKERDAGGKVEFTAQVTKFLEWNLKAEKLVLGDFYNHYDPERFDRFPFAITTNLNFILK